MSRKVDKWLMLLDNYCDADFKKLFKVISTPKKSLEKRLPEYHKYYLDYKNWRNNFEFPGTEYLIRLKNLKPQPNDNLIRNLSKAISELRQEYLKLNDFRAVIIFTLFLFYFSELFIVKKKIKISKKILFSNETPRKIDIALVRGDIVGNRLKIHALYDDIKKISHKPPKPWNQRGSGPYSLCTEDHSEELNINAYKKYENEFNKLKIKNNPKVNERLSKLFFKLIYCKKNEAIESLFLKKS